MIFGMSGENTFMADGGTGTETPNYITAAIEQIMSIAPSVGHQDATVAALTSALNLMGQGYFPSPNRPDYVAEWFALWLADGLANLLKAWDTATLVAVFGVEGDADLDVNLGLNRTQDGGHMVHAHVTPNDNAPTARCLHITVEVHGS